MSVALGILYTIVPNFVDNNNTSTTKYLGLLYLSISICAIFTYYLKLNLDAYIIISSIRDFVPFHKISITARI